MTRFITIAMVMLVNDATIYDAQLEAGDEPAIPCPVCTGDEDAPPCDERCARLVDEVRFHRRVRRVYAAARRAMLMAHLYVEESGKKKDPRAMACVERVRALRMSIRLMRGIRRAQALLRAVA